MWLREDVAERLLQRIEESDKAISGAVARDKVMWSQTAIFMDMGMANKKVMQQGMELYRATMSALRQDMVTIVSSFRGGQIDVNTAIKDFKYFMNRHYQTIFKAGAMAAGNPYYADPAIGLTKKDLAFISAARRQELGFFKKFLLDMSNPYHHPRHPYLKRAGYYADSGKAQFFNGMVNGAGENVEINWVLGVAEEHCHDCPIIAAKTYTWQTLPTTPGAGDTACIFNCKCHLEFQRRQAAPAAGGGYGVPIVPGSATQAATEVPGRWSGVTNLKYQDMMGQITKDFDDLFAQMNKARQMVNITSGLERKEWIQIRRDINDRIINRMKLADVRVTPTVSVKELIDTIQAAKGKAAGGVLTRAMMTDGTEVLLVRGNATVIGVVQRVGGELMVSTAAGQRWQYDDKRDIALLVGGPVATTPAAPSALPWSPKMSAEQASAWSADSTIKISLYHNTNQGSAESIVAGGFRASSGLYGNGAYFSTKAERSYGAQSLEVRINVKRLYEWNNEVYEASNRWWFEKHPGVDAAPMRRITEYLKAMGYDGIRVPRGDHEWYCVFDPKRTTVVKVNGQPTVAATPVTAPAAPVVRDYKMLPQKDIYSRSEWDTAYADALLLVNKAKQLMSDSVATGLSNYQNWTYGILNRYLRYGDTSGINPVAARKAIAVLDKAMVLSKINKDVILHRVTHTDSYGNLRVGSTFVDKGYLSTSTQLSGAENLMRAGKWRVEVRVPKGTPAVSFPAVGSPKVKQNSMTREELEILLPRNCRFKVLDINQTNKTMSVELLDIGGKAV